MYLIELKRKYILDLAELGDEKRDGRPGDLDRSDPGRAQRSEIAEQHSLRQRVN